MLEEPGCRIAQLIAGPIFYVQQVSRRYLRWRSTANRRKYRNGPALDRGYFAFHGDGRRQQWKTGLCMDLIESAVHLCARRFRVSRFAPSFLQRSSKRALLRTPAPDPLMDSAASAAAFTRSRGLRAISGFQLFCLPSSRWPFRGDAATSAGSCPPNPSGSDCRRLWHSARTRTPRPYGRSVDRCHSAS
jgi:hypothetical protein